MNFLNWKGCFEGELLLRQANLVAYKAKSEDHSYIIEH